MMDCRDFERWLDEGRPAGDSVAARDAAAHAAACPTCAGALRDMDEWESALSQRFTVAPDGFTDRVMTRLPERAESEALSVPEDRESPWPWWLQALLEPAALLGLLLGMLYAVAAPTLMGTGRDVAPSLITRLTQLVTTLPDPTWLRSPAGQLVMIGAAVVVSLGLFRGSIALFDRISRLRPR